MELKGKISQIIGAVVDVMFNEGDVLPDIYTALSVTRPDGVEIILECQQDIGENTMRTIAMDCWASLEHQLKYKKNIRNTALIVDELKRCADEMASTDLSMQTIRDLIQRG